MVVTGALVTPNYSVLNFFFHRSYNYYVCPFLLKFALYNDFD